MKIFRILDVARYESSAIKSVSRLNTYASGILHSGYAIKARPIRKISGLTLINNRNILHVSTDIRKGYFKSLSHVYDVKVIPKDLELRTFHDVKDLPAYHFGKAERYTNTMTENIKSKSPPGALDHLEKGTSDLSIKDLDKSPALKETCKFIQGKTLTTIAGKVVVVGIGFLLAIEFLNEHRKDMQACIAYRVINGNLQGCKIPTCTCIDGSMNSRDNKYNLCGTDLMNMLPPDMKSVSNCQGNTGLSCVNCPSQAFRDMYGKDANASLDQNTKADEIYVECRIPSIFNALGDITHSIGESTLGVIQGAATATTWFLKNLPSILIGGGAIFAIVIVVWFLRSLGVFGGGNKNGYNELDNYKRNKRKDSGYVSE